MDVDVRRTTPPRRAPPRRPRARRLRWTIPPRGPPPRRLPARQPRAATGTNGRGNRKNHQNHRGSSIARGRRRSRGRPPRRGTRRRLGRVRKTASSRSAARARGDGSLDFLRRVEPDDVVGTVAGLDRRRAGQHRHARRAAAVTGKVFLGPPPPRRRRRRRGSKSRAGRVRKSPRLGAERRGIVPRVQRREQTRVVERRVRPGCAAPSPPKGRPVAPRISAMNSSGPKTVVASAVAFSIARDADGAGGESHARRGERRLHAIQQLHRGGGVRAAVAAVLVPRGGQSAAARTTRRSPRAMSTAAATSAATSPAAPNRPLPSRSAHSSRR